MEFRFSSIDSTKLTVGGKVRNYLRIKHSMATVASSKNFEKIIFIPNTEGDENLVILLPRKEIPEIKENLCSLISRDLAEMKVEQQEAEDKHFWLPRFKLDLKQENSWTGLDAGELGLVLQSTEAAHFELFAPEASIGALDLEPSFPSKEANIVVDSDFFFAITQSELNEQLDVPFFTCSVPKETW